jgi:hypothetical protein
MVLHLGGSAEENYTSTLRNVTQGLRLDQCQTLLYSVMNLRFRQRVKDIINYLNDYLLLKEISSLIGSFVELVIKPLGVRGVLCGSEGTHLAGGCVLSKLG